MYYITTNLEQNKMYLRTTVSYVIGALYFFVLMNLRDTCSNVIVTLYTFYKNFMINEY